MALTEAQKAELIKHFSCKAFVSALKALLAERRDGLYGKLKATPKDSFHDEAMTLVITKGGIMALDSLTEELTRLEETANE